MSKVISLDKNEIDYILSPVAIRDRAQKIFNLTLEGKTSFQFNEDKFSWSLDYLLNVIKKKYPDLNIPFHSRWGHFRVGGIDRVKKIDNELAGIDSIEKARIKLDLVITSVLLDAGAGASWNYDENGKSFSRSEGLGVASFYMFTNGLMSSDRKSKKADAKGLNQVTVNDLNKSFQVSEKNPLLGVEGRVLLLNNLGQALENKSIFKDSRPGNIIDYLISKHGKNIPATAILKAVLDGLGPIWPGRLQADGINLGDVWQYSKFTGSKTIDQLVPFHKLSQWMTYSLIEPIIEAGLTVTGVEKLTGLAEYRNGGFMIDSGLITLKNSEDLKKPWTPDSDLIIEWRALTIYLLDKFGVEVQKAFGKSAQDFPLAKVLEGGTWWAGRYLAKDKRENGDPPIMIKSDGTVF